MLLAQQLNYPKTEQELRILQDWLYAQTKEALETGEPFGFKGILEVASSETVILSAIHKIKANKGSQTPGTDGEEMRKDILEKDKQKVIERVKNQFCNYQPQTIRRAYIPKPNKPGEMRPLGTQQLLTG